MSSGLERKLMVMCGEVKALSRKISPKRACALLENPERRANMSDQLAGQLVLRCGELNAVEPAPPLLREMPGSGGDPVFAGQVGTADRLINVGDGYIQSETTLASSPSGVLCAAWNDSGEYAPDGIGFTGFGSSSDGGVTWTDGGGFPPGPGGDSDFGDPSLAYSVRDGAFYFAALSVNGLSLWKSTNNCTTFTYVGVIAFGFGHDKELIAVDNNPASAYYGRIYAGWTNFFRFKDLNVAAYSDDGGATWTSQRTMPGSGINGQGMWPAIAPNGDVYFALVNRSNVVGGLQDQWIYKSTDGGDTWVKATSIGTGQLRPEDVASSNACGRQALKGNIRNLSSPQIAIHADAAAAAGYVIHAVYPYDSDGAGADNSNAFYRRSTDGAATWSAERKLHDDGTNRDQFYPAVNVSSGGIVVASWYDRRSDVNNINFGRYAVISNDGGLTWGANQRIGDVESPLAQTNPNFDPVVANCYHGDYDQLVVDRRGAAFVWSDDRRITATGPNPDVYFDRILF
jgi:hypothetical protein